MPGRPFLRPVALALMGGVTGWAFWHSGHVAYRPTRAAPAAPRPAPRAPLPDDEDTPDRDSGPRFGEAGVYVDGTPVAVMKYGELPPGLPVHQKKLPDGRLVPRFLLAEYFEALGIDLHAIRQTHWYGGRARVAIVDGAEFRRNARRLYFSFTREVAGKPRLHWPGAGFRTNDSIDTVVAIAVYVKRKPPRWNAAEWYLEDESGKQIEGIPYATEELRGGTRIYVDGRLAGTIKRNLLSSATMVPGSDKDGAPPRYSLAAFLARFGVDPRAHQTLDLIDGDLVMAHLRPADFTGPLEFAPVIDSHGQVRLDLWQNNLRSQFMVTALSLHGRRRAVAVR
ncbi:MAG TPA: hypothetical protein VKN99_25255 [Polyangia bacterium]|nr:hypothetical protein [Polyangia bacterium]